MKKLYVYLLLIGISFLSSCSSIPQTIYPKEEYGNLNGTPIYLTTKKAVTLTDLIHEKAFSSNKALKDEFITEYQIKNDTLSCQFGIYYSKINFSNIEKIEFDGIYDNQVGPITKKEIKQNISYGGSIANGILFGIIGLYASAYLSQLINPIQLHLFSNKNHGTEFNDIATIVEVIGGTIGSTILGYNIGYKSDMNTAIEKIKEKRIYKKIGK